MIFPSSQTLRGRSVRTFYLYGGLAVLLYAAAVLVLLAKSEDRLIINRLDRIADRAILDLLETPASRPLAGERVGVYVGEEELPLGLRPLFETLDFGTHEIHERFLHLDDVEHFVAVRRVPELDTRVFVYLAGESIEGTTLWWSPVLASFVLGLGLVAMAGPWLGARFADRLVEPLTQLTTLVESSDVNELSEKVKSAGFTGEVGVLADSLAQAANRCTAYATRERHFTRSASHELRSPVTVIRGAADLLGEQLSEDSKALQRLGRIGRSLDHMEELIEAFLWLARERGTETGQSCDVGEAIRSVAEQQRALHPRRATDLEVEVAGSLWVAAPNTMVRIVVGNLISNALRHSVSGPVVASLTESRFVVTDQGPGFCRQSPSRESDFGALDASGHGLGLAIVDEVCQRFGWSLQPTVSKAGGTSLTLDFEM